MPMDKIVEGEGEDEVTYYYADISGPLGITNIGLDEITFTISLDTAAHDLAGNSVVATPEGMTTIVYDPVPPTATDAPTTIGDDEYISAEEFLAGDGYIDITVPLGESGAVIGDTITLSLDGNPSNFDPPLTATLTSDTQHVFTVSQAQLGSDGQKSITAIVTDIAGNIGQESPALLITIDTVAPEVSITSPEADTKVNGSFTVSFDDDKNVTPECSIDNDNWILCESGITTFSQITGFDDLPDDDFTLYLKDTDYVGYVGTDSIDLIKDVTGPVILISSIEDDDTVNGSAVLTFSGDETDPQCSINEGEAASCTSGVTTLSDISGFDELDEDAIFTLIIGDLDDIANPGSTSLSLVKDTVAPIVSIDSPAESTSLNGSATFEFSDDELTAPECSIDAGANWTPCTSNTTTFAQIEGFDELPENGFTLSLKDTDSAGNASLTSTRSFNKDSIGPELLINSPDESTTLNGSATFGFESNEEFNTPQCSIDAGANWTPCTSNTTTFSQITGFDDLDDGEFTLSLKDIDSLSNIGSTSLDLIKDTTGPVLLISSIEDDDTVNGSAVLTFSGNETDPQCSINEGEAASCTSGETTLSDISGFDELDEDATFTLLITDVDDISNPGSISLSLVKDTVAPEVSIDSPAESTTLNGSATFEFSDDEPTAPECSIDDGENWTLCTSEETIFSDIEGFDDLEDGEFTLSLKDTDSAGNASLTSTRTFIKDATAPLATSTPTTTAGSYINSAEELAGFDIVVPLGESGALEGDTLDLLLGGTPFPTPLTRTLTADDITADSYTFTIDTDELGTDGTKVITSKITDIAGNVGATSTLTLTLDTEAPATPSATPSANTYTSAQSVSLSATGSTSIRYSTSVTPANCSAGTEYSEAISVSSTSTIYVLACDAAENTSSASFAYTINISSGGGSILTPSSQRTTTTKSTTGSTTNSDPSLPAAALTDISTGATLSFDQPVDLPDSGFISDTIVISNTAGTVSLSIPSDTMVTDDNGVRYPGTIGQPQVELVSSLPASVPPPAGTKTVYVVSVETDLPINFSNDIRIVIPLPDYIDPNEAVIYYYDTKTHEYIYVGGTPTADGTGIEVYVNHLTTFVVVTPDESSATFEDLPSDHWAAGYVKILTTRGILKYGNVDGHFLPTAPVTRAEMAQISLLAFGIEIPKSVTSSMFTDIKTTDWFAPCVQTAGELGIIAGYDGGTFKPNAPVSRVEALRILLGSSGLSLSTDQPVSFKDVNLTAWYAPYLKLALEKNIVKGYTSTVFKPANSISRAEIAVIVAKLLTAMEQ